MDHTAEVRISFPSASGQQLDARLVTPASGKIIAVALFAHCFTCTKDSHAARRITKSLASQGLAVLRFDFTGIGRSEGNFAESGFISNIDDIIAAAAFLRGNIAAPSLLIGHSLGGTAAIAAAAEIPEVKAVATIGSPSDPIKTIGRVGSELLDLAEDDMVEVSIARNKFCIDGKFVQQFVGQSLKSKLKDLDKAILVLHAPGDTIVSVDEAGAIFAAAKHPKSFVSLDKADHLLHQDGSAENAARVISAWAWPYLTVLDIKDDPPVVGVVRVETAEGKFLQNVTTASHQFLADEPKAIGGKDIGPNPYDFLLASLGTCTSMTIKMYADFKKIPLEGVRIDLEHDREHAADCENCESDKSRIDVIDRSIELIGDLSSEQRDKLIAIADKCPVHRTLENHIEVRTTALQ